MSGTLADVDNYIQPQEFGAYGLMGVPERYVERASAIVDVLLKRPEGLLWVPDYAGWPCYMGRLNPRLSITVAGPINAGSGVQVAVPGMLDNDSDSLVGDVAVLDRASANLVEACVIQSATPGTVTLYTVQNTHPGPVTLDFGLVIEEERSLPNQRSVTRVAKWPIGRLHSGVGRYGYGRRSDQMLGYFDDVNLLSMFQTFGGPPKWEFFETQASSINADTGEVWVPAGVLLAYFTDVKLRYVAGWQATAIPQPIKEATAAIALAVQGAQLPSNILSYKAGDTALTRSVMSILDDDTIRLLLPFKAFNFI
jgi:hypothetical protein